MDKKKILVVEDEIIVSEDIKRSLQALGYVVPAVAYTGEMAIQKVEEFKPDLILMDIILKGDIDGITTTEKIRSRFDIPIVFLTAHSDPKTLERARITEPYGYIIKPFKERELNINIEIALFRHRMELKLKETKEWLSTTLNSIGDAVIATDSKGYIMFMNPMAQLLTGWSLEDAVIKPLNDVYNIVDENTGNEIKFSIDKVVKKNNLNNNLNISLISKKGERIPIEESGNPIKNNEGDILGFVIVFHDITERKKTENEIMAIKNFYEIIIEGIVTGIWVTDKNDVIQYSNKGMSEFLNRKESITGINMADFSDSLKPYYMIAKESLQPYYYQGLLFILKGGKASYQSGWLIPRIKSGNFNGMICTVENLSKTGCIEL